MADESSKTFDRKRKEKDSDIKMLKIYCLKKNKTFYTFLFHSVF